MSRMLNWSANNSTSKTRHVTVKQIYLQDKKITWEPRYFEKLISNQSSKSIHWKIINFKKSKKILKNKVDPAKFYTSLQITPYQFFSIKIIKRAWKSIQFNLYLNKVHSYFAIHPTNLIRFSNKIVGSTSINFKQRICFNFFLNWSFYFLHFVECKNLHFHNEINLRIPFLWE